MPTTTSSISNREHDILFLVAYGHSTKEMAKELCLAESTINGYRKNLMKKLGVKNTAGLVRKGYELNFLILQRENGQMRTVKFRQEMSSP